MTISNEDIKYLVESFRDAETIFSLDNIKQHLADGETIPSYNSLLGMMVTGYFGWLDNKKNPDYNIIMDSGQIGREPFNWVSW